LAVFSGNQMRLNEWKLSFSRVWRIGSVMRSK
jgi:hypothetical protein